MTEIMPLVSGTVDNHKTPNNAAKIKIVNSVLGKNIKIKNKNDLKLYSITNKFFFDWLSPKYPNRRVPNTLNRPIKANDHDPIQIGKDKSSK